MNRRIDRKCKCFVLDPLQFSTDVQECDMMILDSIIETSLITHVIAYTYVIYLQIILCQKTQFLMPLHTYLWTERNS